MALFYKNKKTFYISLLTIISLSLCSNNDIYRVPFGLYYIYENNDTEKIIRNIFFNYLYANLSLGNPSQIVPFEININSQTFFVPSKYFNRNISLTYEDLSKKEVSYSFEDAEKGFNSRDILDINGIKKKINFIFETKLRNYTSIDYDIGNIGLLIPTKLENGVYPFMDSLKKAGFIKSSIWTLKFSNKISMLDIIFNNEKWSKIIGELIIGDAPHNYEKNKKIYNSSEFIEVNASWSKEGLFWDIEFYDIYLTLKNNETEQKTNSTKVRIHGDHSAEINPDIGFIVAPIPFFEIINLYFFRKNKRNMCNYIKIRTIFRYIECENISSLNLSDFPDISFDFKDITFNLTYEDLFIYDKNKKKYIFLIFYEGYTDHWVLGRLFLRKYQFSFNEDTKKIGYYKSMNDFNREFDIEDNKKIIIYIGIIIKLLFLIFPFSFILFIKKKYNNIKRKKRINEIDDDQLDDNLKNNNLLNNKEY